LCEYAKRWANRLAERDRFEHNPEQKYGENIYMFSASGKNPKVKFCSENFQKRNEVTSDQILVFGFNAS